MTVVFPRHNAAEYWEHFYIPQIGGSMCAKY